MDREAIIDRISETLITAGSTFSESKKEAYRRAIEKESNDNAKWALQTILENAEAAERSRSPLCDDTGIPHVIIEIGPHISLTGDILSAISEGVKKGLEELPGRPMGIMGSDSERIDQSGGLSQDPGFVEHAPFLIRNVDEDVLRVFITMQGGGPAIRGKTYRVFHKHNVETVVDEIVKWATESVGMLGCSPCTLAVGIGRSQYEAASMMTLAQAEGDYNRQSDIEKEITDRINKANIGSLGLGGDVSVLATFLKVGPQRASGVRIVSMRPMCCFEPRIASADLKDLI
ncbi:MAG: fumarate hydratase [Eubacterium sp.]|nr:fumarate hydratase [Eubacterium sp.]